MSVPQPIPLTLDQIRVPRKAKIWDWFAFLLKKKIRFQVQGNSMLPLLVEGDEVFVRPQYKNKSQIQIGDLVVIQHPYRTDLILIKYVASIQAQGAIYVLGTNLKESTDSRSFGWIAPHLIRGCIWSRFKPDSLS